MTINAENLVMDILRSNAAKQHAEEAAAAAQRLPARLQLVERLVQIHWDVLIEKAQVEGVADHPRVRAMRDMTILVMRSSALMRLLQPDGDLVGRSIDVGRQVADLAETISDMVAGLHGLADDAVVDRLVDNYKALVVELSNTQESSP